jgi:hypothetical protein
VRPAGRHPKGEVELGRLVGEWKWVASSDGKPLGTGRAAFALESAGFLRQTADDDPWPAPSRDWETHSPMPTEAVIGFDDTTGDMAMLYSDARGVRRIYQMSLSRTEWRLWRNAPGFNQRFVGRLERDGRSIVGRWETSEDGNSWAVDFDMTYEKVGS